jgi:ABC-type branched-subunit amino acid transport system substrate-binding protein
MHRTLTRAGIAALAALALVATACGDDGGGEGAGTTTTAREAGGGGVAADRGNVEGTLRLGTLVPQSGDLAVIVESLQVPVDLAVQEINDAGGVNDRPVEVVPGDDGTNPNVAQTTYAKLVNTDRVDAIIGPAPSGVAAKLLGSIGTDQVPTCSGSTTAANLSGGGEGYFFRTAPGDNLQGPALAELIVGDNHANVAIVARNDDYGKGFADLLADALRGSGGEVTTTVLYDPNSSSGYAADVQKAVDSRPDAVAVIGFNDDGAEIVSTMIGQGAGPAQIPIYTADGMQSSGFAESVDPADPSKVAGIKGTAPAAAPAGIEHPFTARFAATGVDTIFSSYYYDCTILMALAAEKAGSDRGADIAAAFAENLKGDNDCNTFAACKQLLRDGETIHYRGASSAFDRWETMEPGTGVYDVWEYLPSGEYANVEGVEQIRIGD